MRRAVLALWVAAGAAIVLAVIVLAGVGSSGRSGSGGGSSRSAGGMTPVAAHAFADSIGVNVHLTYNTTPYGDFGRVLASLQKLGVHHIRDGLVPNRPDQIERFKQLAAAGIRADVIMGAPNSINLAQLIGDLKRARPAVEAVEGPNEYDISGDPHWRQSLIRYQRALYGRVREDPTLRDLTVFGPTVVTTRDFDVNGALRGAMNLANAHPYAGGGPPEPALRQNGTLLARAAGTSALVATEVGYHDDRGPDQPGNLSVSEGVAADYLPRLFLSAYGDGYRRTYWYELVNTGADPTKPDQNYGLLRADFAPKPAFGALQNLMRLVSDPKDSKVHALPLSISQPPGQVRRLLLEKSDGTYLLALWRELPLSAAGRKAADERPASVRVRLPDKADQVSLFRPSRSPRPVATWRHAATVAVPMRGDAVILQFKLPQT
jgi:hypothetical protein